MNWLVAIVLVMFIQVFAFRGTNAALFIVDIILLIFLATVLKSCGL